MPSRIETNRKFAADLFAGPFRGHGIVIMPEVTPADWTRGDFSISEEPLSVWADDVVRDYERWLAWHEDLEDDSVPYAILPTGTEIFAAAFGCRVNLMEETPPHAIPLVTTVEEADKIPVPDMTARPLARVFEMGEIVRERLGPDVPISVPDIQSPFDIAALIWRKEDLFVAMCENPGAVKRLVEKCHLLLERFLLELKERLGEVNYCHCPPHVWAPPELGCWLSEDEAGSMSVSMFEEFCLPSLIRLSETFGGLFMHCCATADHQYASFNKIPNLRGINRVFQAPGPEPAIRAFENRTVLMQSWLDEQSANAFMDMALPGTRYLFVLPHQLLDEARGTLERLRKRCAAAMEYTR